MTQTETRAQTAVYAIADAYVERVAALDPCAATSMGAAGHDDRMTDYSPAGFERRAGDARSTLAELAAAPVEHERDRIARETMAESLALGIERAEAGEHFRNLSIIGSPIQAIRRVFDLMPKATEADWETIARRLERVPPTVMSFRATLEEGRRRGLSGAQRQAEATAMQCETWSGGDGRQPFFAGLVAGATAVPESLRADLERQAALAANAYAVFGRYLREEYLPAASERDGVGPERYQLSSRAFNGVDLDLEETYAWGWEELYRVEQEMAETCKRILPGASVAETIVHLEADPARSIDGVEAFRQWMQDLQDRTIAEMEGKHFEIPGPVKRIEALIAPPGGALAMYYTSPSEDFSRPGRTWYPAGGKTRFPLWGEVSIAYHEGVPGHHLERGSVKYLAGELSRFQRLMGGTSGYVEGWALYAERLMGELGYLDDPGYYLGMLRAQALRSVRVIVDIGMHLELAIPRTEAFHGGEPWDAVLGQEFANTRSCFPADFMASEITRYLGTPAQAISYKVGERCWLEARDTARRRAGASFDLKAFHAHALGTGPMGLAQMQRELGAG